MTNTPSPTDEDREMIEPSEVKLWNELTDMILEWEDGEGDETAGSLARRIVAIFRRESADRLESLLSDRAKLEEAITKIADRCWQADEANWQHDILSITVPITDGMIDATRAALTSRTDHTP